MTEKTRKDFFSVQEVADFLVVSESTVRRYIRNGQLPAYRLGDQRLIRIRLQDLEDLLTPINAAHSDEDE